MSWRKCPFEKGKHYRLNASFSKSSQDFVQGHLLQFIEEIYSHYDNLTVYAFEDKTAQFKISLEIRDDERPEDWTSMFDEV